MTDTEVHFPEPESAEQGQNPVQTGFDKKQAIVFLEQSISAWKECDRSDVRLLRAICRLSLEHPERAAGGFSAPELVESVVALSGRPWSSPNDKEKMAYDVRKAWKRLGERWEKKKLGIHQAYTDRGMTLVPELAKFEGGGTGNLSRYFIQWTGLDLNDEAAGKAPSTAKEAEDGSVRYICEDIADPPPLVRAFTRGYRLVGWRRWFLLLALAAPVLLVYLVFMHVVYDITFAAAVGAAGVLKSVGGLVFTFIVVWLTIGPLLSVATNKIVVAPWWLQSYDDDRLLEHRSPPGLAKSIKAVTYTAVCPLCGGKVYAKSGGIEFFGRVVGRCRNSPIEHVFSFDHVTRRGKPLR